MKNAVVYGTTKAKTQHYGTTRERNDYVMPPAEVTGLITRLSQLPATQWGEQRSRILRAEEVATKLGKLSAASYRALGGKTTEFNANAITGRQTICRREVVERMLEMRAKLQELAAVIHALPLLTKRQLADLAREARLTEALYREYQRRFRRAEAMFLSPGNLRLTLASEMAGGSLVKAQAMVYQPDTAFDKDGRYCF